LIFPEELEKEKTAKMSPQLQVRQHFFCYEKIIVLKNLSKIIFKLSRYNSHPSRNEMQQHIFRKQDDKSSNGRIEEKKIQLQTTMQTNSLT
jgi:hypothetical protein